MSKDFQRRFRRLTPDLPWCLDVKFRLKRIREEEVWSRANEIYDVMG